MRLKIRCGLEFAIAGKRIRATPRHLAAVHQRIANHEIHQGRRDAEFLGDVLLRHAVQAVHLERVASTAGQLGQRVGDVFQGREVDVRGFRRCALDHHVQTLFFRARILQLQRLFAVVVDRQVAHDLEQVAELSLERRRDLRRRLQPEERILHHVFSTRPAAGNAGCNLDQNQSIVDECLK